MKNDELLQKMAKEYVEQDGENLLNENSEIDNAPTPALDVKMKTALSQKSWFMRYRARISVAASLLVLFAVGLTFLPSVLRNDISLDTTIPPGGGAQPSVIPDTGAALWGATTTQPSADAEMGFVMPPGALPEDAPDRGGQTSPPQLQLVPPYEMPRPIVPASPPHLELRETAVGEQQYSSSVDEDMFGISQVYITAPTGWRITLSGIIDGTSMALFENYTQNLVRVVISLIPESTILSGFTPMEINGVTAYLQIESSHSMLIYEYDNLQVILTTQANYRYMITIAQHLISTLN